VQRQVAVVVPLIMRARSADSGKEGEARTAHVWTMAAGRATTLRVYADRERALDATS
jgi:ketosteroid isomerase-like protein